MRKVSNSVKVILLLLTVILFVSGCNIRLATKEDWKTAAPEKSAAETAVFDTTPCVTLAPKEPDVSAAATDAAGSPVPVPVPTAAPTAVPTAAPAPTAKKPSATAAKPADIPTTEAPKTNKPATAKPTATPVPKQTLTLSIQGPEGMILSKTRLQYDSKESKTVFDITMEACNNNGIEVVYTGSVKRHTIYIQGIGGIFEKDYGGSSGWIYFVNGTFASVGISSYVLKDGDVVEWQYTR